MNSLKFNEKYKGYFQNNFTGVTFDDAEILKFLDLRFNKLIISTPLLKINKLALIDKELCFETNLSDFYEDGFELESSICVAVEVILEGREQNK